MAAQNTDPGGDYTGLNLSRDTVQDGRIFCVDLLGTLAQEKPLRALAFCCESADERQSRIDGNAA